MTDTGKRELANAIRWQASGGLISWRAKTTCGHGVRRCCDKPCDLAEIGRHAAGNDDGVVRRHDRSTREKMREQEGVVDHNHVGMSGPVERLQVEALQGEWPAPAQAKVGIAAHASPHLLRHGKWNVLAKSANAPLRPFRQAGHLVLRLRVFKELLGRLPGLGEPLKAEIVLSSHEEGVREGPSTKEDAREQRKILFEHGETDGIWER